ncbi:MAG: TonB-dependent receptor [Tahibacter sp.]
MIHRKKLLAASVIAALSFAGHSQAATAPAPAADNSADATTAADAAPAASGSAQELEEVVVTGIRQSLQKSLDSKREADSHVEVITAEDIGKMPDKNVADSLQRVPGVTISSASANEGGFDENDRVSMRGTNPSLTQTLINGHSVSSGDWFVLNQTGTVGRSVSYSLLPSELVGRVVVHKTSQASDIEGGVAGSVDIQSRRPLDFKNPITLEGTLGGVYAELPSKTDPQISALFNWKNDSRNLGFLVQAFSETRHLRRDGQELLGYEKIAPGSAVATAHPDLAGVWYPTLVGSALFEQERKRKGGLIDIDFRPTDNLSFDLSAFSSKMDAANYNRNYMLWNTHFISQGAGQSPDAGYVVRNGTLVQANFSPVAGTTYGVYDQISRPDASSDSNFVNLDASFRVTDALNFTGKVGSTRGHGKNDTQDVAEWNTGIGTGAAYQLNGINSAADWSLGNENTGSPINNSLGWIFGDQNINVRDKENWFQVDGEYSLNGGALTALRFGARQADHDRKSDGVIGQGPSASPSPFNAANYPVGYQNYPNDFGDGLGGNFPRDIWYYTADQLHAFNAQYTNRDPITRADWNSDYALEEQNRAAYLQADFSGNGWTGNVGVRYVKTEENVIANVAATALTPGAITTSAFGPYLPTHFDNTYNDILPSGNLKFDVAEDLVMRFAASKTMTRADYSALAGPINLGAPPDPGAIGSGNASNPDLKPVRSTNFDASLEWYFAPRSVLSASLFHMNLTSYIGIGQVLRTYRAFNQANPNGYDAQYLLSQPVNSKGTVKGIELAYEQPLFENFGVAANYTYADGEETGGGPLVGTSKNTYNVSAYYENETFNARVSYTHRSSFYSGLDRLTAFYQAGGGSLSAAFGYTVNEHLSFNLDLLNLNSPTLKYYALNTDQPRSIYENGRQVYLTAHLRF